jgi:integrase
VKDQYKQRAVTLMLRARVDGKWSRYKAIYGRTGRVIPGLVISRDRELKLPEVSYELRFYQNGKPHYRAAGKNAMYAEEQRRTLAAQLSVKSLAKSAGIDVELETDRKSTKHWASTYMEKQSVLLGSSQVRRISFAIELFFESCKKTYIDELIESDLLGVLRHLSTLPVYRNLRAKPSKRRNASQRRTRCPVTDGVISARTIFSYYMCIWKWLLEGGADAKIFPPPPKYEEPEVTVYSPEQIKSLFALVTGDLRIALNLMLKCGLRRKEVAFAYFSDINFADKTILVRGKPEWDFKVKNRIQRYIPVPDDLLEELRPWEADHPRQRLIIQTAKGGPELRMIRHLKRFVYLHGLRCGRCHH